MNSVQGDPWCVKTEMEIKTPLKTLLYYIAVLSIDSSSYYILHPSSYFCSTYSVFTLTQCKSSLNHVVKVMMKGNSPGSKDRQFDSLLQTVATLYRVSMDASKLLY